MIVSMSTFVQTPPALIMLYRASPSVVGHILNRPPQELSHISLLARPCDGVKEKKSEMGQSRLMRSRKILNV
ncbi:unnamed protein product [Dracunculus medinensis]|uniref:Secreted protein n=1 Tax=Dracunculus medinensis TaxID=318479 RepID=A0A0N4UE72_DRAME|nr:unnamed protein product [Dracunculus medinensis]